MERFNPASLRRVDSDGIECSVYCNCRSECERIVSWNSNGIKRFEYELFGGKKIRRFVDSDGIEFGVTVNLNGTGERIVSWNVCI